MTLFIHSLLHSAYWAFGFSLLFSYIGVTEASPEMPDIPFPKWDPQLKTTTCIFNSSLHPDP